jgi:magnesium-transporting ATPase (P-type)
LYSLYKNITFTLPIAYWACFNGFSGQTLYDAWMITLYNIVFASVPVLVYALFEKDLPEDVLLTYPQLYKRLQLGLPFTLRKRLAWFCNAIWDSIVCYWAAHALFANRTLSGVFVAGGQPRGLYDMGVLVSSASVIIVNLRIALETLNWNFFNHFFTWGTIAVSSIAYVSYSFLWVPAKPDTSSEGTIGAIYYTLPNLIITPIYPFYLMLVIFLCLGPQLFLRCVKLFYFPPDCWIMRERVGSGLSPLPEYEIPLPNASDQSPPGAQPRTVGSATPPMQHKLKALEGA